VVLGYAIYWARKSQKDFQGSKAAFLWNKFPKFVLGFLLISLLSTMNFFSKSQIADLANLSRWAFLLTFAGVGLQTNLGQLRKQGLKPLAKRFLAGTIVSSKRAAFRESLPLPDHNSSVPAVGHPENEFLDISPDMSASRL